MMYLHYRKPLIVCMLVCLLSCTFACLISLAEESKETALARPHAKSYSSRSKATTGEGPKKIRVVKPQTKPKVQALKTLIRRTLTVSEWFDKYDQIRRDAEMTMGDKWQSLLLQAKKPEPNNAALATRMSKKYSRALSEMKKLGSTPETKALQVGYIEYFVTARQLFEDYLVAQKEVPFTNQSLVPTKKKLEVLDKRNKEIDDGLRKRHIIRKHRHS
jgi:hypothetical protein